MNFSPQQVVQGNRLKKEAEESPTTFATEGGASFNAPVENLDQKNSVRMAGPGGAFAMKMLQDPQLAQRVNQWSQLFGQSVPGMQFNQAKMMMMGMGGAPQSKGQESQKPQQQQQQQKPQQPANKKGAPQ